MPQYNGDPSRASAFEELFDKGDYEFIIGEAKAFERTATAGHQSYGIGFSLACDTDGPFKGKRKYIQLYKHSLEAEPMNKRFTMAALGYELTPVGEKRFNADWAGKDWGFDTDSKAVGDAWRELTGRRIVGALDSKPNPNTGDQQQTYSWRPL